MVVSAKDVAEMRKLAAEHPDAHDNSLAALHTLPELIGYITLYARQQELDEADFVELFARAAELEQHELREAEPILRALGYRLVADRLRKLARRKRCC